MAVGGTDTATMMAVLPVRPGENPFVVAVGGFYRRWFNLVDDLRPLLDTVAALTGTEDEDRVPAWSAVAARFLRPYHSGAAFCPAEVGPLKCQAFEKYRKDYGLLDNIRVPMLLINGTQDHLSPIGDLYLALESGPPTGRVARVYPHEGHIAAKNEREWGPAASRWLREQLMR